MTHARLVALFLRERAKFGPRAARTGLRLQIDRPKRAKDRDQAFVKRIGEGWRMTFYASALELPENNIIGLLRHEFGHVVRPEASEREVDLIAEQVTGTPINYDARGIQTIGPGEHPRPAHLPK
jgi:hypothetical protein